MTAHRNRGTIAPHVGAIERLGAMSHRAVSTWLATAGAAVVMLGVAAAIVIESGGLGASGGRSGPVAAVSSPSVPAPSLWSPDASTSGEPSTSPAPSAIAPSPSPSPSPTPSGPFAMDLYSRGEFATERRPIWCVAAAMLTSINVMAHTSDTSIATEQRLYTLARSLSSPRLRGNGAEPEGWAAGLQQLGYGRYVVLAFRSRTGAIQAAAAAIRRTGRPAGLMVWYGAHSWVMSGFTATADPASTTAFTVTAVHIEDVWYPRISSIWGASRPPDSLVPVPKLPRDFLPWKRPTGHYPDKDGRFVVVLPVGG
jgi:hypothetical protein